MSMCSRILTKRQCIYRVFAPQVLQFRRYGRNFGPFLREIRNRQLLVGSSETPNHRNTYLEWNYSTELYAFSKRLGEEFEDALLRRALTERSYMLKLEEDTKKVGITSAPDGEADVLDNSLLVDRGEEILADVVVRYLRHLLPRLPEEGVQSIKNHLLSESAITDIASHIGLTELILCQDNPVEDATHNRVFKALITALHDSSGLDRVALFIRDFILTQLAQKNVNDYWSIENPVELLHTICRNEHVNEPEPRLVGQCAVNTLLPLYRVAFYIDKRMIGLDDFLCTGPGETVQTAKEMAASDALWRLFGTAEHQLNIRFDAVVDPSAIDIPNVSADEWSEKKVQERLRANR